FRGDPVVAMDADGDYVIAWTHFSDVVLPEIAGDDVVAQRFDAAGNPRGGAFTANSDSSADQVFPAVAMDTAGDFVISWERNASFINSHVLQARLFNSQGFAGAQEFAINTPAPQSVRWGPTEVAMDAGGDFAVVWDASYSSGPGDGYQINARRFDASGTPRGGSFPVTDFPSTAPNE